MPPASDGVEIVASLLLGVKKSPDLNGVDLPLRTGRFAMVLLATSPSGSVSTTLVKSSFVFCFGRVKRVRSLGLKAVPVITTVRVDDILWRHFGAFNLQ